MGVCLVLFFKCLFTQKIRPLKKTDEKTVYQPSIITGTILYSVIVVTQPAFICSKLTIETVEQGVKYVQS